MDKKEVEAWARKAAKGIKTEEELNDFRQMLTKVTVETALNAELDEHLGYERHAQSDSDNYRNGYTRKTLLTEDGPLSIETPRDRQGTFEPQLVKKQQTRFTTMDEKILSLYAKGMTTREIVATFKDMYDADVSPTRFNLPHRLSGLYRAKNSARETSHQQVRLLGARRHYGRPQRAFRLVVIRKRGG